MTKPPTETTRKTNWALISLSLSMLMPSLDTSIANAGLPTLAQAFGASFHAVQWIVIAYLLATTTLIVSAGRLGDVIGRRRLLLAGIVLFTVASLLCGAAPALSFLIAARAAQGLGAAIMMALTMASVSETVPREKTGSTFGLLGTMSAIGTTLGPSLGGFLIAGVGWRAIFLVNVPLGTLNFLLARRYLPADRKHPKADAASVGNAGMRGIVLATWHNHVLRAGLARAALVSTVMMTTLVVGPFYLSRALGLDVARVGLVLSIGPLVAALTGVPAGRIVDRLGAERTVAWGLVGMAVGCFVLSALPVTFGIAGYIAPIVCITASYALFQAANTTSVMTDVRADQRGVVSGMLSLARNLGLIAGASVMGAVFALASGTREVAVAAGMRVTFAVAGVLVSIGMAAGQSLRHGISRSAGMPSLVRSERT